MHIISNLGQDQTKIESKNAAYAHGKGWIVQVRVVEENEAKKLF